MSETTQKTDTVRSERNTARFGRYVFFKFRTGQRLASEYGVCSGQVDRRTGEILATITYGLFQYLSLIHISLCRDCLEEHCVQTNCLQCDIGNWPGCRYADIKRQGLQKAKEGGENDV